MGNDESRPVDVPVVLRISAAVWLFLGILGTLWSLMGLLIVLAFGGTIPVATYLPALALSLGSEAVFVAAGVLSVLLGRGVRPARLVLTLFALILPAVIFFRGGPPVGEVPWAQVLLSPVGAVCAGALAATVLMWLPPAHRYLARRRAGLPEPPASSGAGSGRLPWPLAGAVWLLVVSGVIAALQAVLGMTLLAGTLGSGANPAPALLLWLTLAAAAAADLVCARAVRRAKPFSRYIVTVIPLAGLGLMVLATLAGVSSMSPGSTPPGGLPGAVLLTVLSQGLPLLGGAAAAVLVWLPASRLHFRNSSLPSDPSITDRSPLPPAWG
ncbi:hypothetical protein [Arthrobacter sp. B3I4]|uniref:hypothetical protein n=1 Tax=Arthrobacter sp. B3I4 TaxID=3042267 RepID=UPI002789454C|nr:hypothetical protein [Arthrobacter sp. B3I4]MDQ0756715.1 hypothetical protein [Arthrobacter sp. B3I4]